jgi:hypothetical protein
MRLCRRYVVFFALLCLRVLCAPLAHASVAVLLEEPYGWFSHLSPSGHTSVYLDNICAETPLHVRPCHAGEFGVVISRYDGIGDHDWIAVPLTGYLYAVESPKDIPAFVSRADVARLRDAYRRQTLMSVAPDLPNGSAPGGNWYELAGAAFNRTIYGFQVNSTPEQDAALISFLNDNPNHYNYNGVLRNCADFVRLTVNRFYPRAIRRNYIADLGVTSPKSVARGLSHFAAKHPEAGLKTFKITQVPGTLPRSHAPVTLMEGITKEFGIPLFFLSPIATGAVATAWLTQGRFPEPKHAPELNLRLDAPLANAGASPPVVP